MTNIAHSRSGLPRRFDHGLRRPGWPCVIALCLAAAGCGGGGDPPGPWDLGGGMVMAADGAIVIDATATGSVAALFPAVPASASSNEPGNVGM
jgi:hypothetical protein